GAVGVSARGSGVPSPRDAGPGAARCAVERVSGSRGSAWSARVCRRGDGGVGGLDGEQTRARRGSLYPASRRRAGRLMAEGGCFKNLLAGIGGLTVVAA